jgi:hypothetical protein
MPGEAGCLTIAAFSYEFDRAQFPVADWTGMVETELFATTYRNYALATVRYPVLEV